MIAYNSSRDVPQRRQWPMVEWGLILTAKTKSSGGESISCKKQCSWLELRAAPHCVRGAVQWQRAPELRPFDTTA